IYITHLEYQHDESLLLNYKFLASNLTSIPIIQNFKIMHYQHTLKFASKSYFHNFRVNHTQDQSLSDNTHDFNDKIHVKPIDKKYTCNNRYLFVPI
ncbi:TPA: hypothetical protein ACJVIW_002207, partial [Streptococcus agalactiae]